MPENEPDTVTANPREEPTPVIRISSVKVFSSEAEFAAHYLDVPKEQMARVLTKEQMDNMMYHEINKPSPHKRFLK